MATIREMRNRVKRLKQGFPSICAGALFENREKYLEMNKEQMLKGIDSTGELIGFYAQRSYEDMKVKMGFIDTVNLKLTGEFQNKMVIRMQGYSKFDVTSVDKKKTKLVAKYGEQIFGLTDANKEAFRMVLADDIKRNVNRILFNEG